MSLNYGKVGIYNVINHQDLSVIKFNIVMCTGINLFISINSRI